jgi:hypothetical protein
MLQRRAYFIAGCEQRDGGGGKTMIDDMLKAAGERTHQRERKRLTMQGIE